MSIYRKSVVAGLLRASVLAGKFFFTIYLARILSYADFGLWVLIVAIIGYGVFLIGAEIYNITLRNYINNGGGNDARPLSRQWSSFLAIYITVLLLSLFFGFFQNTYSSSLIFICALLLLFEHGTQEMHRLAIYRDNQIQANIILYIKSTGWMLPFVFIYSNQSNLVTLADVLNWWLYGVSIAFLYCIYVYWDVLKAMRLKSPHLTKQQIAIYVNQLLPFWMLALATRTPLVLDRYFLEIFADREQLSVYGYYITFGNGIQSMFDAILISKLIPQLLNKTTSFNKHSVFSLVTKYMLLSVLFWVGSMMLVYLFMPVFNFYTDKTIFDDSKIIFIYIGVGQMLFSLSVLIQYGLYSLHLDNEIKKGALVYLALSTTLLLALTPAFGNRGAVLAMGISAFTLFLIRLIQFRKLNDAKNRFSP